MVSKAKQVSVNVNVSASVNSGVSTPNGKGNTSNSNATNLLELHPALKKILPKHSGFAPTETVANIQLNGPMNIEISDGKIVSNYDTYLACVQLGIKPPLVSVDPKGGILTNDEVVARFCSDNFFREYYNPGQRSAMAVLSTSVFSPLSANNVESDVNNISSAKTRMIDLSIQFNVSSSLISKAGSLYRKDRASFDQVHRGELKIGKALLRIKNNIAMKNGVKSSQLQYRQARSLAKGFMNFLSKINAPASITNKIKSIYKDIESRC